MPAVTKNRAWVIVLELLLLAISTYGVIICLYIGVVLTIIEWHNVTITSFTSDDVRLKLFGLGAGAAVGFSIMTVALVRLYYDLADK